MNPEEKHIIDELTKRAAEIPGADYFARLKVEVMEKASTSSLLDPSQSPSKEAGKSVPLYRKTWFQVAAAASVVLIIALFVLNGSKEPQPLTAQTQKPDWESVSQEEVLAYIQENIDDFETETIAEHLDSIPQWSAGEELAVNNVSAAPKTMQKNADKYDELFRDIDRDDILEYLEAEGELDEDLLF